MCGDNVTNMGRAYRGCNKLTGSPACGPNVTNMAEAYYNCTNLSGNAYFYSSVVSNMRNCFYNKNNSKRLNIYVPANSTTNTTIHYNNTYSIVGKTITWTNPGSYQYNTTYNIYIYPVENVEATYLGHTYNNQKIDLLDDNIMVNIDNSATIKTQWEYAADELTIDTGHAFVMNVNMEDLQNVTVEEVEVL